MTPRQLIQGLFPGVIYVSEPGTKQDRVAAMLAYPLPDGVHVLWVSPAVKDSARNAAQKGIEDEQNSDYPAGGA